MNAVSVSKLGAALLLGCGLLAPAAQADTQTVFYSHLVSTAVVATPLLAQDTLFVDTFTTERGPLRQTTTFTVGADVQSFTGNAAWLVNTATGVGPRLIDVNIDLFDAGNQLIQSDSFAGLLAGFAHSTFSGSLEPGIYTLVATGTGVRDSSLDISLTLAVPEPATYAMLLAGLGLVGLGLRRRESEDEPEPSVNM
ncbi:MULTISPECIES: PEPxxWA-CTERM sorting domain-containing protein [unclassified Janthinobacterium]|uniref:PEPxxWA-CTERM sorting domain-containing protein n=1 Tax=unclassified Janthinobacterium TaxID=2610881 RepID=UPI0003492371|nr:MULTISPECIES: PEPxxWA-CTERM sorting domain-containing protein [unclassified Janthinobacterium]MEC5163355.1 hypothetical protein [Janthinobacterium sp. CG_S6]